MKFVKIDTFPQESGPRLCLDYHIEGVHPLRTDRAAVNRVEDYLYANKRAVRDPRGVQLLST